MGFFRPLNRKLYGFIKLRWVSQYDSIITFRSIQCDRETKSVLIFIGVQDNQLGTRPVLKNRNSPYFRTQYGRLSMSRASVSCLGD